MTIADFGFSPLTVAPGATVTVTNTDGVPHTVTAVGGEFATGLIDPGATVAFVAPTQPGTYTFFCDVHPPCKGRSSSSDGARPAEPPLTTPNQPNNQLN